MIASVKCISRSFSLSNFQFYLLEENLICNYEPLRHKTECKDSSFTRDVLKEDLETNGFNFPQWEIVMHGDDESDSGLALLKYTFSQSVSAK